MLFLLYAQCLKSTLATTMVRVSTMVPVLLTWMSYMFDSSKTHYNGASEQYHISYYVYRNQIRSILHPDLVYDQIYSMYLHIFTCWTWITLDFGAEGNHKKPKISTVIISWVACPAAMNCEMWWVSFNGNVIVPYLLHLPFKKKKYIGIVWYTCRVSSLSFTSSSAEALFTFQSSDTLFVWACFSNDTWSRPACIFYRLFFHI